MWGPRRDDVEPLIGIQGTGSQDEAKKFRQKWVAIRTNIDFSNFLDAYSSRV
jgi:hypothetical protein